MYGKFQHCRPRSYFCLVATFSKCINLIGTTKSIQGKTIKIHAKKYLVRVIPIIISLLSSIGTISKTLNLNAKCQIYTRTPTKINIFGHMVNIASILKPNFSTRSRFSQTMNRHDIMSVCRPHESPHM